MSRCFFFFFNGAVHAKTTIYRIFARFIIRREKQILGGGGGGLLESEKKIRDNYTF